MRTLLIVLGLLTACASSPRSPASTVDLTNVRISKSAEGTFLLEGVDGYDTQRNRKPLGAGSMASDYERNLRAGNEDWTVRLGVDVEVSSGNTCLSLSIRGADGGEIWSHSTLGLNRFLYQWKTPDQPDERVTIDLTAEPVLILRDRNAKTTERCAWDPAARKFTR